MEPLIIAVHILVSLAIIGLILLQQGKGADMGASFGSGGSQTLFGSTGSGNLLSHTTAILVTIFFATSLGLSILAKNKSQIGVEAGVPDTALIEAHNAGAQSQAEPRDAQQPAGDVPAVVPADDGHDHSVQDAVPVVDEPAAIAPATAPEPATPVTTGEPVKTAPAEAAATKKE